MVVYISLLVVGIIALIGSAIWFYFQPGFEPFITVVAGIGALIEAFQSKPKKQSKEAKEEDHHLSKKCRKTDLKLLHEFWPYINSTRIRLVVEHYDRRILSYDFFVSTVIEYQHLRNSGHEKRFINPDLEEALSKFDEILAEYVKQMPIGASVRSIHGEDRIVPDYKHQGWLPQAEYRRLLALDNKTNEIGIQLIQQHNELVEIIKTILPEFDFTGE